MRLFGLWLSGLLCAAALAVEARAEPSAYRLIDSWGRTGSGQGQFHEPTGIAAGSDSVYVADTGNQRVQRLSLSGRFVDQLGEGAGFRKPIDVALGPNRTIYVGDFELDRIFAFSADGALLHKWGKTGTAPGAFEAPAGLAVDQQGRVYVAGFHDGRVQVFDSSGKWIRSIGGKGRGPGQFTYPTDVAVQGEAVFVADAYNHRVQKLSLDGKALAAWGQRWKRFLGLRGAFRVPTGVALDSQGRIHVADSANRRVVMLSPEGRFLGDWKMKDGKPDVYSPTRVAVLGDKVLAVDTANDRILVLEVLLK